jgi:hypothetical protein
MIYVANGPNDVPTFSVVKNNGGKTLALYPKGDATAFSEVNKLITEGRIDMFAEADYSEDSTTNMWLSEQVTILADNIYARNKEALSRNTSKVTEDINE